MKRLAIVLVAGLSSLGAAGAWAMPPQEAKTRLEQHATHRGLQASEVSQAVDTLERLLGKGVPVDHAYRVVKAAIDDGIRGTDLAEIARAMEREQARGVPPAEAADRALAQIRARAHERGADRTRPPRAGTDTPPRGDYGPRGGGAGRHPGADRPGR